jgi:hypothetical protein
MDPDYGKRLYFVAPKLAQARLCYEALYQMIQKEPELSEITKKRRTDIYIAETNSSAEPLAFSEKTSDGFNPSAVTCDELGAWSGEQGLKQYEVMKSALGARRQPMLVNITTAGYQNESIYDELMKRATAVINGTSRETRFAPFLYMVDDPEKWNDINELAKANPNLGVSVTVDFFLEEGQQVFIAGLKEVLEASLGTQEILDGKFVFGFVAQDPFAVIHFEEGPVAGLHCQAADLHDFAGLIAPAAGAGRHHIEESRPFGIDCFRRLAVQIFEVLCERGLGRIRHMVLGDNGGQVLAVLDLAVRTFACRCCRRVRKHGCRRRALNAGVHIGTIIITHIDHIMSTFHGTGKRLETNIIGSAVSAEGYELKVCILRKLPSFLKSPVCRLYSRQGRSGILKGIVYVTVLPGRVGIHKR